MLFKLTARLTNDVLAGPLNPALVGFTFSTAEANVPDRVARVAAYLTSIAPLCFAANTFLTGIDMSLPDDPSAGVMAQAFPTTEYADVRSNMASVANVVQPRVMLAYNDAQLSGAFTSSVGRGVGLCCNTKGVGGRRAAGRHFLPYAADAIIESFTGVLVPAAKTQIEATYRLLMIAGGPSLPPGDAAVFSAGVTPPIGPPSPAKVTGITSVAVSLIPSRLRSRTR